MVVSHIYAEGSWPCRNSPMPLLYKSSKLLLELKFPSFFDNGQVTKMDGKWGPQFSVTSLPSDRWYHLNPTNELMSQLIPCSCHNRSMRTTSHYSVWLKSIHPHNFYIVNFKAFDTPYVTEHSRCLCNLTCK